jgi:hypothetical protein
MATPNRPKPLIIVLSRPDDDQFNWISGGWYSEELRGTAQGDELYERAVDCIDAADNYAEAIRNLELKGFEVDRRGENE